MSTSGIKSRQSAVFGRFLAFMRNVWRSICESAVDGVESPRCVKDVSVTSCVLFWFHFWERVKQVGV